MILFAGFMGKLLEFVVTKLLGAKIDLALNDKKKAGSFFMKLYLSISQLEIITGEVLREFEEVLTMEGARLRPRWLERITEDADKASKQFLDNFSELSSIVGIYDPDLSNALLALEHNKKFFMATASSMRLIHDEKGGRFTALFRRPTEKLMNLDMNQYLEGSRLDSLDFGDPSMVDEFKGADNRTIEEVYVRLKAHASILSTAREHLREFIATKFSMEDLLHVRKLDS